MIVELLAESLLLTTGALMLMPLVALRARRAFAPHELTRFNATTMTTGASLLFVALVLCATPSVVAIWGWQVFNGHFFPGELVVGWVSAVTAFGVGVLFAIGWVRTTRLETRLWVELGIGFHESRDGYELVVLPSSESVAYAIPRPTPQVVVTTGVVESLSAREFEAVVTHEVAHLKNGHHRHLRFLGALSMFSGIRPIRRLVDSVRLGLEFAADEATDDARATVRALVKLHSGNTPMPVAGFTASDVGQRIDMLSGVPGTHPTSRRAIYLVASVLMTMSAVSLIAYWL